MAISGQRIPWTEQEEQILTQMSEAGAYADEIAVILKTRNKNSIKIKAQIMGLSLSGPTPEIDMDAFKKFLKEKR